jgi:phage terminase small subunit
MACDAWDRYHEAREILARDGIVVGGRQAAVRPHPAIAIERENRVIFARLISQLALDIDPNVRAARRSTRPGGWKASNGQTQQPHSTD